MSAALQNGRYDPAMRRQSIRKGREKGCSVYIAAEALLHAGVDPNGPAPYYRVWAGQRGRFIVTLYHNP